MDPYADYGARILANDGFEMSGAVGSGIKATVKYLVPDANVFLLLNAMVNPVNQVTVGTIVYSLPYQLPTSVAATPIFVQSFGVKRAGVRPDLPPGVPAAGGLAAGEFYRYSILTIGFEQLPYSTDAAGQDPNGHNQLDPENPLTFCEQSVKIGAQMETRKGRSYLYDSTNKPVPTDFGVRVVEAKLVLKFPRVPYLPWQLVQPYVGRVNSNTVLTAAAETLLLEGADTNAKQSFGAAVPIENAVSLEFAWKPDGWNKVPKPDGTLDRVHRSGDSGTSIYEKADFRQIFTTLNFSRAT